MNRKQTFDCNMCCSFGNYSSQIPPGLRTPAHAGVRRCGTFFPATPALSDKRQGSSRPQPFFYAPLPLLCRAHLVLIVWPLPIKSTHVGAACLRLFRRACLSVLCSSPHSPVFKEQYLWNYEPNYSFLLSYSCWYFCCNYAKVINTLTLKILGLTMR